MKISKDYRIKAQVILISLVSIHLLEVLIVLAGATSVGVAIQICNFIFTPTLAIWSLFNIVSLSKRVYQSKNDVRQKTTSILSKEIFLAYTLSTLTVILAPFLFIGTLYVIGGFILKD